MQYHSLKRIDVETNSCPHPQAMMHYRDVKKAGPPANPLDFPTPRVRRASFLDVPVLDHVSGKIHETKSILLPSGNEANQAYLFKKKLARSSYGGIVLCLVLRRRLMKDTIDRFDQVEWETTDDRVAIKSSCWTRMRQARGENLEDPLKEVAALQYTGDYHPNVLGCVEVLQDERNLYTVMRHCSGGSLYSSVVPPSSKANNLRDEGQAWIWFRQLLQALCHLQKKGICHRDLSLENIVLDGHNNLVLIDFGLAVRVPYNDESNAGRVADVSEGGTRRLMKKQGQSGNLAYLAPEIVEDCDAFDGFSVDLWSAGVILFVLLVGMAPFKWANKADFRFNEINRGRLKEMLQSMDIHLSDSACDLLQNMLWRDPSKRLSLAEVLQHPWVVGMGATSDLGSVSPRSILPTRTTNTGYFSRGH